MSFVGKLARGLLQGAAGYYGKVAEQQEYDRRADILMEREMALKNLDAQLDRQGETHRGNIDAGLERVQTAATIEINAADEEAKFATWLKKQPIELRSQLTLEDFRQDRQDSRYQEGQDRQDRRQQRQLDERVVATGTDADGNLTVAKGNDAIVRFRNLRPKGVVDEGGSRVRPRPEEAEPAAASPPPASSAEAPTKTYTLAEAEQTAAKYGVSIEEVHRSMREAGYTQAR